LYITHVHAHLEGDTFFPAIDFDVWELAEKESFQQDEKNQYNFDFCVYKRKSN
jgi:dihydrofolate reductase